MATATTQVAQCGFHRRFGDPASSAPRRERTDAQRGKSSRIALFPGAAIHARGEAARVHESSRQTRALLSRCTVPETPLWAEAAGVRRRPTE